jgi:hypothetical protein
MSHYQLAQLNIGIMRAPLDSPVMADFMANLDRINALAEAAPGFVWRLQTEEGNATAFRPLDEWTIINMSVLADVEPLRAYVYKTAHTDHLRRRGEWFQRMAEAYLVLWWVPAGHRPTVDEALERLDALRRRGPTAEAFTFRRLFPRPDAPPDDGAAPQSSGGATQEARPGGTHDHNPIH